MNKILQIINDNIESKDFAEHRFLGDVYFRGENGLDIDSTKYAETLKVFNAALENAGEPTVAESCVLMIFVNELVNEAENRVHYRTTALLNSGLTSLCRVITTLKDNTTTTTDSIVRFKWENIDHIDFIENKNHKELSTFRFQEKNNLEYHDIIIDRFGTDSLKLSEKVVNMFRRIVAYKNKLIETHVELQSNIEKLFNEEDYEAGILALDDFSTKYDIDDINSDDSSFYYFNKTFGLRSMGKYDEALETIDRYIDKYQEQGEKEPYTFELKGELLRHQKRYIAAINCFAISEAHYENEIYKKGVQEKKEEVYSSLRKKFLKMPYERRKIVFIAEDIHATEGNNMVVLRKKHLPSKVNFPKGHPKLNEIYVCHPKKQDVYLPIAVYNESLFKDKILEFNSLVKSLGAAEITYTVLQDDSSKSVKASNKCIAGFLEEEGLQSQHLNPSKQVMVPNNLFWYPTISDWQALAEQRLSSNLLTTTTTLSNVVSDGISKDELKQINAELKILLPKLGLSFEKDKLVSNRVCKTLTCQVDVTFFDMNTLNQDTTVSKGVGLTSGSGMKTDYQKNLARYEEEVLFMLEDDGKIDGTERRLLNRKIERLGIDEADALAIENKLLQLNFSKDEIKYVEALKEILEEGGSLDEERKLLNRYASKFNITSERQAQIELKYLT